MNWRHLIDAAWLLAGRGRMAAPGRPRQVMLKRAVSTAYYAMFHSLCYSNANVLIGSSARARNSPEWIRTYRSLNHGFAKDSMIKDSSIDSQAIRGFGAAFSTLQENRHWADYDPSKRFLLRDVRFLINRAETSTEDFLAAGVAERRALATVVLLRGR